MSASRFYWAEDGNIFCPAGLVSLENSQALLETYDDEMRAARDMQNWVEHARLAAIGAQLCLARMSVRRFQCGR